MLGGVMSQGSLQSLKAFEMGGGDLLVSSS